IQPLVHFQVIDLETQAANLVQIPGVPCETQGVVAQLQTQGRNAPLSARVFPNRKKYFLGLLRRKYEGSGLGFGDPGRPRRCRFCDIHSLTLSRLMAFRRPSAAAVIKDSPHSFGSCFSVVANRCMASGFTGRNPGSPSNRGVRPFHAEKPAGPPPQPPAEGQAGKPAGTDRWRRGPGPGAGSPSPAGLPAGTAVARKSRGAPGAPVARRDWRAPPKGRERAVPVSGPANGATAPLR